MILRDRISLVNTHTGAVIKDNIPARVSYKRVDGMSELGRPYRLGEWLEVMVGPAVPYEAFDNSVLWRGVTYMTDGPPAVVMRGDKVHHLTIGLKRITG